ncbi:hypothetical protein CRG98_005353 [Punica granatum]|uniref:Integrase catalytic domain-containing protein n=1 Tax=Punica granatum TaxID=22663 RepID=A0A2I0L0L0_PUNGR|nr:hypothetical protein CRG98_005353 [Punica granatum]
MVSITKEDLIEALEIEIAKGPTHCDVIKDRPKMNGAVEAANKNIKKIIEKITLNLINERQLIALCHDQCYQQKMARAFSKRVRPHKFSPGDLVLQKVLHISPDSRGKFAYKYNGPYIVKEVFSGGGIFLTDMDGNKNVLSVNADTLKKYYP